MDILGLWIWVVWFAVCSAIDFKAPIHSQLQYPYRNDSSISLLLGPSSIQVTSLTVVAQSYTKTLETTVLVDSQLEKTPPSIITSQLPELTTDDWTKAVSYTTIGVVLPDLPSSNVPLTLPKVIIPPQSKPTRSVWTTTGTPERSGLSLLSFLTVSTVFRNTPSSHVSSIETLSVIDGIPASNAETNSEVTSVMSTSKTSNQALSPTQDSTSNTAQAIVRSTSSTASATQYTPQQYFTASSKSSTLFTDSTRTTMLSVATSRSAINQTTPTASKTRKSLLIDSVEPFSWETRTEVGLPSTLPKEILPNVTSFSHSTESAIVYIGFQYPLNYAFVAHNREAALQIFEILPDTLLQTQNEQVSILKLLPYHAEEAHVFVKTLAMVAYPKARVETLLVELHVPNSVVYMQGNDLNRAMASLIDPGISNRELSPTDCIGSECHAARKADKPHGGAATKATTVGVIVGGTSLSGAIGVAIFCAIRRRRKRRGQGGRLKSARGEAWRRYHRIESAQPPMRHFDSRTISRPIASWNSLGI